MAVDLLRGEHPRTSRGSRRSRGGSPTRAGSPTPRRTRSSREGKAIVLVTCNIHSTEIGASQMAMEWAHALATAEDAETKRRLDDVVLLLVPSLNPDGQIMVTDWYRKNLGTPLRGRPACRGSTTTTSATTTTATGSCSRRRRRGPLTRAVYHEWFPQVFLDEHQMGADRAAHVRAALRRSGRPRHPPADLARGEPDRRQHGAAARAGEARAASSTATQYDAYWPGGTQEHRRGGRTSPGCSPRSPRRGSRRPCASSRTSCAGGSKGLVEYGPPDQLPQPVAGRVVAAARHHGLRADRLRRAPRELRRAPRGLPAQRARARARRGRARSTPTDAYPHSRAPARRGRRAQRLAALLAEHGVEVRAGRERRRLDPARAALRPLRAGDADAAALPGGQARRRAATSCGPTTWRPGRCR